MHFDITENRNLSEFDESDGENTTIFNSCENGKHLQLDTFSKCGNDMSYDNSGDETPLIFTNVNICQENTCDVEDIINCR